MEIINGKIIQKNYLTKMKKELSLLSLKYQIAVISTGTNPYQTSYLKSIKNLSTTLDIPINFYHYEYISSNKLLELIDKLNKDNNISGILILYPLIPNLDETIIRNKITPKKDIEGLGDKNTSLEYYLPCTALGIIMTLDWYNINIENKSIVIINRTKRVGIPLFNYFITKSANVTIYNRNTKNTNLLSNADIIITATGTNLNINKNIFKDNCIIIDAGMREENNHIVGDISNLKEIKYKYYLPPIGGVGPMTVTALAKNILISYYLNYQDKYYL